MKVLGCSLLLVSLVFGACSKDKNPKHTEKYTMKYFSPEVCCANLYILNGQQVYGDKAGYSSESLAAVNLQPFIDELNIEPGDTIQVEFVFADQEYPCTTACGRLDGIPIEVLRIEK